MMMRRIFVFTGEKHDKKLAEVKGEAEFTKIPSHDESV